MKVVKSINVGFKSTEGGFHITFANGNTVSVQWGYGTHSSAGRKHVDYSYSVGVPKTQAILEWVTVPETSSVNAEISARNDQGESHSFDGGRTMEWATPEDLAELMHGLSKGPITKIPNDGLDYGDGKGYGEFIDEVREWSSVMGDDESEEDDDG